MQFAITPVENPVFVRKFQLLRADHMNGRPVFCFDPHRAETAH